MYGDAVKNDAHLRFSPLDKFKNDHFGHIEKFKNDHIGHLCKHEIRSSISSTNSSELKQLKYPSNFRQWPDPPPPPRKGKSEKQTCCLKRRPGSADPRFHRHLSNVEKHKPLTYSEIKTIKKNPQKDISEDNIIPIDNKPKLRSSNFCNFKIKNVNDWLENQITFQSEESKYEYEKNVNENKPADSKYSQTDKNKLCIEDNTDSSSRELSYIKDFANILQEKEDSGNENEYKETINLTPNDVIHKFPDFSKNFYEMAESEASFVTELTAKVLNHQSDDNIGNIDNMIVKNTFPMLLQANILDEIYEKNKKLKPVITKEDSQLSLRFSNTLSTNSFYLQPNIDILSRCTSVKLIFFLTITITLVLFVNYLFMNFSNLLWYKLLGKPEETWIEKYLLNPLKNPACTVGKVFNKIIEVLSIPNKFNVDPYII